MPKFCKSSFSILSTCHQDLQTIFFEVVKTFDCTIICGYRNQEDQEKAFMEGNTQLHWPHGKHNHLPSLAVDAVPYPIEWNNFKRFYLFAGFVLGTAEQLKSQGKINSSIRWGGDWKCERLIHEQKFNDFPHYEII